MSSVKGEFSVFIVMRLPFLRRKIKKKITVKIYRKVQSIQESYIFFKQSEVFFS